MSLEYFVSDVGQWVRDLPNRTSTLFTYPFCRELRRGGEPACGFLIGYDSSGVILVNYSLASGFHLTRSDTQYARAPKAEVTVFNPDQRIMVNLTRIFSPRADEEGTYCPIRVGGIGGINLINTSLPPVLGHAVEIGDVGQWSKSFGRFMESIDGPITGFAVELNINGDYPGYGIMCYAGISSIAMVNYSTFTPLKIIDGKTTIQAQAEIFLFSLREDYLNELKVKFNVQEHIPI